MDNLESMQVTSENATSELQEQEISSTDMNNVVDTAEQEIAVEDQAINDMDVNKSINEPLQQLDFMMETPKQASQQGKQSSDDSNFDPFTAPLDSMPPMMTPPPTNTGMPPQSYAVPMNEVIPGKKSHIGLIIGIIIAAIIAICALTVLFVPKVNNAIMKTVLSPEKYYQKIEKIYIEKNSKAIGSDYASMKEMYSKRINASYDGSLKVTLGNDFAKKNNINAFQSAGLDFNLIAKNDLEKLDCKVNLNETQVVSLNSFINIDKNDVYFQIPELTKKFGMISGEDLEKSLNQNFKANNFAADDSVNGEMLEAVINKYSEIIYSSAKDVSIKNNVKGSTAELSYEYSVITVNFTGEEVKKIADEILTKMKNDEDMKTIFVAAGACEEDGYEDLIQNAIESLDEDSSIEDKDVKMKLWINSNADVVGREFEMSDNIIGYLTALKGNKYSLSIWGNSDSEQSNVKIDLGGTTDGKKFSGSGSLKVDKYGEESEIPFSFKDYEKTDEINGYINGQFTISIPENDMKIVADFKGTNKDQKSLFSISDKDGKIADIEFNYKQNEGTPEDIVIPTENVYDVYKDTDAYTSDIDYEAFYTSIKGKVDIDAIMKDFYNVFYGSNGTDDFYDSDYSDSDSGDADY